MFGVVPGEGRVLKEVMLYPGDVLGVSINLYGKDHRDWGKFLEYHLWFQPPSHFFSCSSNYPGQGIDVRGFWIAHCQGETASLGSFLHILTRDSRQLVFFLCPTVSVQKSHFPLYKWTLKVFVCMPSSIFSSVILPTKFTLLFFCHLHFRAHTM